MINRRVTVLFLFYLGWSLAVLLRLYHWQVAAKDKFSFALEKQLTVTKKINPQRGRIYSSDGFPLVLNQDKFLLYAWLPTVKNEFSQIINDLKPIIFKDEKQGPVDQKIKVLEKNYHASRQKNWFAIQSHLGKEQKQKVEWLNISGLGFEKQSERFYPEASMAASLLGFLGSDETGRPKGYFGLEGYYQQQLSGMAGLEKSSSGILKWLEAKREEKQPKNGRSLQLFIDRSAQFIAEEELKKGIKKYGAKSGWVIILDPQSGGVLAEASYPTYRPEKYYRYPYASFLDPIISETFEPGSVFKPLVMAAALEEGVVSPETKCAICQGPVQIGKYKIETWNKVYHPNSTMTEVIKRSSNVGMVFVIRKLGLDKFLDYFQKFNLDQKTGIDLQGEVSLEIKKKSAWYPVDLATASFGQGIALTPVQLITAFNSLADGGSVVRPRVVAKIISGKDSQNTQKKAISQPFSKETTEKITAMLEMAVEEGEARWAKPKGYLIAGKTGTAQIPIGGHYDKSKTIASFIGFAPSRNPKFTMLVSLKEPTSSPWGSETAAPLWFAIADRLFKYWGIAPTQ